MNTDHTSPTDDARQNDTAPQAPDSSARDITDAKPRALTVMTLLLFFVLLLAHVAFSIEPQILYQADEFLRPDHSIPVFPAYFQGMAFFKPFLSVPGGLAEYLGANIGQYFGVRYGGAAILTAIALIAFLTTGALIDAMGGKKGGLARLVPPLLLVVIWGRYTFVLADQIALLAALLAALLYFRLPDRADVRAAAILLGVAALYYVAAGPCMLLAGVCGLYELIARRRRFLGITLLAIGALVPLALGTTVFGLSLSQVYLQRTGLHGGGRVASIACIGLYGFFILAAIVLALRGRSAPPAEGVADESSQGSPGASRALAVSAVVLIVSILVAVLTLDRDVRTFRRICYSFQMKAWGATILAALQYPSSHYTADTCRMLNRALYEKGMLGREMFAYPQARPQARQSGLLPELQAPQPYKQASQPYKNDTLVKLGAVDIAERLALDSLGKWGDRPFVLRLLAKIYTAKGNLPAAQRYLRRLSADIVHGQFAMEQLAKLSDSQAVYNDEEIMDIRSVMLTAYPRGPLSTQAVLEALVDRNPANQMAFEYLMAHYLLTMQLDRLALRIGHIQNFDYEYMPSHYAEAILLLYSQTQQWSTDETLPKDTGTMARGERFMALSRQYKDDPRGLATAVNQELPGSYFSYYFTTKLATGEIR